MRSFPQTKKPQHHGQGATVVPNDSKDSSKGLTTSKKTERGTSKRGCWNCGMEGHQIKNCPYPKKSSSEGEAHGRRSLPLVTATHNRGTPNPSSRSVEELRQELHQAELLSAIKEKSAVMSTVSLANKHSESHLGPVVFSEVKVNGVATNTLIDTGSPATIVSLKHVLEVFAREKTSSQTGEEWQMCTLKRFTEPKVTLKNYGGQKLDITAQTTLELSQGNHQVEAVVLVQEGAPNDLLLGTDLQTKLGFSLVQEKSDGVIVDLLTGKEQLPKKGKNTPVVSDLGDSQQLSVSGKEVQAVIETGTVHLLKGVRIPAGYQKMVRVKVKDKSRKDFLLFSPQVKGEGLTMTDSALDVTDGPCATLVVENHGKEPVYLKKGMFLGEVTPVEVPQDEEPETAIDGRW